MKHIIMKFQNIGNKKNYMVEKIILYTKDQSAGKSYYI